MSAADALTLLTEGELTVRGQVREASNAVLYCTVSLDGTEAQCVWKPVAGERPLWDFPDGTLAQREVAAYELSEATGWGLVPPRCSARALRAGHGAALGRGRPRGRAARPRRRARAGRRLEGGRPRRGGGGRTALLVHADDPRLRRLAVLDAVINNGDRKGGHLLPTADGTLYAIDHGVTFNTDDKLRTLLWGGRGAADGRGDRGADGGDRRSRRGRAARHPSGPTAHGRGDHRPAGQGRRAAALRHPPRTVGEWPAIPWPPV
ncbi:SCO1664 family protein [Streptomyces zhihengii]